MSSIRARINRFWRRNNGESDSADWQSDRDQRNSEYSNNASSCSTGTKRRTLNLFHTISEASPRSLNRMASTTFHSVSERIRSKAQVFYVSQAESHFSTQPIEDKIAKRHFQKSKLWSSVKSRTNRDSRLEVPLSYKRSSSLISLVSMSGKGVPIIEVKIPNSFLLSENAGGSAGSSSGSSADQLWARKTSESRDMWVKSIQEAFKQLSTVNISGNRPATSRVLSSPCSEASREFMYDSSLFDFDEGISAEDRKFSAISKEDSLKPNVDMRETNPDLTASTNSALAESLPTSSENEGERNKFRISDSQEAKQTHTNAQEQWLGSWGLVDRSCEYEMNNMEKTCSESNKNATIEAHVGTSPPMFRTECIQDATDTLLNFYLKNKRRDMKEKDPSPPFFDMEATTQLIKTVGLELEAPSIGCRYEWDQIRAKRDIRYLAICNSDQDTDSDSDPEPGLELVRLFRRQPINLEELKLPVKRGDNSHTRKSSVDAGTPIDSGLGTCQSGRYCAPEDVEEPGLKQLEQQQPTSSMTGTQTLCGSVGNHPADQPQPLGPTKLRPSNTSPNLARVSEPFCNLAQNRKDSQPHVVRHSLKDSADLKANIESSQHFVNSKIDLQNSSDGTVGSLHSPENSDDKDYLTETEACSSQYSDDTTAAEDLDNKPSKDNQVDFKGSVKVAANHQSGNTSDADMSNTREDNLKNDRSAHGMSSQFSNIGSVESIDFDRSNIFAKLPDSHRDQKDSTIWSHEQDKNDVAFTTSTKEVEVSGSSGSGVEQTNAEEGMEDMEINPIHLFEEVCASPTSLASFEDDTSTLYESDDFHMTFNPAMSPNFGSFATNHDEAYQQTGNELKVMKPKAGKKITDNSTIPQVRLGNLGRVKEGKDSENTNTARKYSKVKVGKKEVCWATEIEIIGENETLVLGDWNEGSEVFDEASTDGSSGQSRITNGNSSDNLQVHPSFATARISI